MLTKDQVSRILRLALENLKREPNVAKIKFPCAVLGDIHGQLFDLIHVLLKKNPEKTNMCFLGDYVDRGRYSIECLTLLMALKAAFPKRIVLLRGNHESRQCAEHFTFRQEVLSKYDEELYTLCMEVFDALPLMCLING